MKYVSCLLGCLIAVGLSSCISTARAVDSQSKDKVQPVIQLQAQAFPLEDVRLLDGPFKHAMDLDRQYLLSLDADRLLHNFRINAGLPSSAQPLGGWEEPKGELRGHFVGHYLSACALMYAGTGDEQFKQKGNAVVAGLAECQAKIGTGYLSAYPETFFDRVEKGQQVWAPYYTLHKIYAGLQDMYVYCDNQQALEVCKKFADWVIARNSKLTDEQMQAMLKIEHGGMNETLANLYALTGDQKYLAIARRFDHMTVLGPASKQQDTLTGLHANTQIPKFVGTAREYELTGDEWCKVASTFFWDTVVKERSYVIGGHSNSESFSPKETLSQAFGPNTTETCNTYNMLKLTRHLLCWDPKAEYADYYERALYNHILCSQNPETGMMCYYVPLRSGSSKRYNEPTTSFWCCTGTGVENHAKYGDSIYFHSDKALYVSLFIASELNWKARGLKLRQDTKYPDEASTKLTFTCDKPADLELKLRHPYWAVNGIEIAVNGQKQPIDSKPGRWATITRSWKSGDVVEVRMPFSLRTEGFKDNPNRFAFLNGPIVLSAEVDASKPFPVIVADQAKLMAAVKPVAGKPGAFSGPSDVFRMPSDIGAKGVTLEPFYKMHGNRQYMVYFDRFTAEQWQAREAEYQVEIARQKELEARTIDQVVCGFEQNERDHNVQGQNSEIRSFNEQSLRSINANGWASWDLKTLPGQAQELTVSFAGRRRGSSTCDLFVNGQKIATIEPQASQPGSQAMRTSDQTYLITPEMIQGKDRITVKLQTSADSTFTVTGIRLLKAQKD